MPELPENYKAFNEPRIVQFKLIDGEYVTQKASGMSSEKGWWAVYGLEGGLPELLVKQDQIRYFQSTPLTQD